MTSTFSLKEPLWSNSGFGRYCSKCFCVVLLGFVFFNNCFTLLERMDWKFIFKMYFQKCTFEDCSFMLLYLIHTTTTFVIQLELLLYSLGVKPLVKIRAKFITKCYNLWYALLPLITFLSPWICAVQAMSHQMHFFRQRIHLLVNNSTAFSYVVLVSIDLAERFNSNCL